MTRGRERLGGGVGRRKAPYGKLAGSLRPDGYRTLRIDGHPLLAHHVAWALMTGGYPSTDIDHINRTRSDNRWDNLRLVTRSENMRNTLAHQDGASGHKGVSWNKGYRKWHVYINTPEGRTNVGYYDNLDAAVAARQEAEQRLWSPPR